MDAIDSVEVRWAQGFTNHKVEFIEEKTICYTTGNFIVFLNIETKMRNVLQSPGRGIGAFAANGNILAFSEHNMNPSIFVFNYPEVALKNELKGTAKLDYTSVTLSNNGPYLACCSSLPDHIITVWNWETADIICMQPQAGKDIISLVFNSMTWLQICALGTETLTIWNIEKRSSFHVMKNSVIDLTGGFDEKDTPSSHNVNAKLTYFGPEMPTSAISGLTGDKGDNFVVQSLSKARLTPTAICWTTTNELYVGCKEGFLLLVSPESLSVQVLFNPTVSAFPELQTISFQSLALHSDGLIATGKDSVIHCLQVNGTEIKISQKWELEEPIRIVMFSPDYETLLLSSNMGQIYRCKPFQSEKIVKVADILNGSFVAVVSFPTGSDVYVSVRESGELQLWSTDGFCIGFILLKTKVTSLACCPVAQYVCVGTASGHVLFVEVIRNEQPRLVHKVHLYRGSVDHLKFDQGGHYIFTGASDAHVYVLDARPSKRFTVIGYTAVAGPILSLTSQYIKDCEQVHVLALCRGQKDSDHEGSMLQLLTLPVKDFTGPECTNLLGALSDHLLHSSLYQVPDALTSCVLGFGEAFACCQKRKTLQKFQLPQALDCPSSQEVVQLKPEQEVEGHPLGNTSLVLCPNNLWLASGGLDGTLRIRETTYMEQYTEIQSHSYRLGGVGCISFADSQTLLTTGLRDGSLVCTKIRTKVPVMGTKYSQSMVHILDNMLKVENPILSNLPLWDQGHVPPTSLTQPQEAKGGTNTKDVTQKDESYTSLPLTTSDPTWLESKRVQDPTLAEKENLPDLVHLETEMEQEVSAVRKEIELENLANMYLQDVLKREYWDSFKVKSKVVKAFHSDLEVKNYPMKERTQKEIDDLLIIECIRKIEKTNSIVQQEIMEKRSTNASEEEQNMEDGQQSLMFMGSFSAELGCSNPHLYDQFKIYTKDQRINQITMLQDVIYKVKAAFNTEFEATLRQKMQEIHWVKDRNRRITQLMLGLEAKESLWEPSLDDSEQPQRAFILEDSEIKVENYLITEQVKGENLNILEENRCLATKADSSLEDALCDMMDGVLEDRKEDILNMEIPQPEFVLKKSEHLWSEEEKRIYKEYEKNSSQLIEEQEKYKNTLRIEMKQLQASIENATRGFDETLAKLFENKVKADIMIYQEELKIAHLGHAILTEEEFAIRESELSLKLHKASTYESQLCKECRTHSEKVEMLGETYNNVVAEDKLLDMRFRKEFLDVSGHVVDNLYKLFKSRPRVQRLWVHSADGLCQMLKAMEKLDSPENMPKHLEPSVWQRFCDIRRAKVESEHQVKVTALNLAEMQDFQKKLTNESEIAKQEITRLCDELHGLREEKFRFQQDSMVQIVIKQGQVEVPPTHLTADYSDAVLLHRGVVEELNKSIQISAEQKIALMVEYKDIRKGVIHQEWEHKRMRMQMEDLKTKAKDIQKLRVTRELRACLSDTHEQHMAKKMSNLEKAIDSQEKTHQKYIQHCKDMIKQLNLQAAKQAKENAILEQELPSLQVAVAERKRIYESVAVATNPERERERRYRDIIQRKKLNDQIKAQAETLAHLRAVLERLRMKNFPALP